MINKILKNLGQCVQNRTKKSMKVAGLSKEEVSQTGKKSDGL